MIRSLWFVKWQRQIDVANRQLCTDERCATRCTLPWNEIFVFLAREAHQGGIRREWRIAYFHLHAFGRTDCKRPTDDSLADDIARAGRKTIWDPAGIPTPSFAHIVVVVEENHSFSEIVGNPQAPYINSLASAGVLLTNYHAISHPSEPNYFALYAGSTFGVQDDGNYSEPDPTLATILQGNGESFIGYVESGSPRQQVPSRSW